MPVILNTAVCTFLSELRDYLDTDFFAAFQLNYLAQKKQKKQAHKQKEQDEENNAEQSETELFNSQPTPDPLTHHGFKDTESINITLSQDNSAEADIMTAQLLTMINIQNIITAALTGLNQQSGPSESP
ncbi:MAG: hypothetical protein M1812_008545, partial [Candelaria pacifica]